MRRGVMSLYSLSARKGTIPPENMLGCFSGRPVDRAPSATHIVGVRERDHTRRPSIRADLYREMAILQPTTTEELSELLKECHARKQVVVPTGGGTHQHVGAPASADAEVLDLSRLRGAVYHDADDMVASYRAGTAVALLQNDLRGLNQRLEVDPSHPASTLGGALAIDHYGPRCHAWGTLRDKVLGMTYVLADGSVIRAGGRTVKNVAGYDLSRLMVGSLGTLGVISEVTLRLSPIGEMQRIWVFAYGSVRDAWNAAQKINRSHLEPVAVCMMDYEAFSKLGETAPEGEALVLVGAEGLEEAVVYHEQQLPMILGRAPDLTIMDERCSSLWERWSGALKDVGLTPFLLRCGCRPGHFPRLLNILYQNYGYYAYVGRGYLFIPVSTVQALDEIRGAFDTIGGYATVWRTSRELDWERVWGTPRGDVAIMRKLKALHDPHGILNPGRFYGGI